MVYHNEVEMEHFYIFRYVRARAKVTVVGIRRMPAGEQRMSHCSRFPSQVAFGIISLAALYYLSFMLLRVL